MYTVFQTHGGNFVNSRPIFEIFSLTDSPVNLQQNPTAPLMHTISAVPKGKNEMKNVAYVIVVPYLCQLVIAAILWAKLLEMSVTLVSLKYALSVGQ